MAENESNRSDTSTNSRALLEESALLGERAKELAEAAHAHVTKAAAEEQSLRHRAAAVDSDLRRLRKVLDAAVLGGAIDPASAEKADEELCKATGVINDGDAAWLLPSKSHGRFLRMFLGPVNVRATRKEDQLKFKQEYNNYRDRTASMFLLFPCVLLMLRSYVWGGCLPPLAFQLFQGWLLFLYTSLALRENILRVNGSDIRPWWIWHHYLAMLLALVSLTWEVKGGASCEAKQRGVPLYLAWAMMQGIAMLLQNRYQRQRLYTRIALGKAKRMDIVWGETTAVEGQLWVLCPILFILQGFQAYLGARLILTAFEGVVSGWQVIFCGILLVVMAVGNFINTVRTLMAKFRFKAKRKKSKSKQNLD